MYETSAVISTRQNVYVLYTLRSIMAEIERPFRICVECGLIQRVDPEVATVCIVCEVYTEMMR